MPRRRPSRALKQQLARPPTELNPLFRALLWAFRSEGSGVLTIGILFAVGTGFRYLIPSDSQDFQMSVIAVFVLLIFGIFVGVIALTEDNRAYRNSGSRIRMTCGAVAFAAIAIMLSASLETVGFAVLFGVILGYVGIYWAKYV